MKTKEEAEEVLSELLNRVGILKRYLKFQIRADADRDGSEYHISIR